MTNVPFGVGPMEWLIEATQDETVVATDIIGYHVVSDTWAAMGGKTGVAPMWISGEVSLTFDEAGPGNGEINISAPPYPETRCPSDYQFPVGTGWYNNTFLGVWIATNGFFYFRADGDATRFGDGFTIAENDALAFHFRYAVANPPPA